MAGTAHGDQDRYAGEILMGVGGGSGRGRWSAVFFVFVGGVEGGGVLFFVMCALLLMVLTFGMLCLLACLLACLPAWLVGWLVGLVGWSVAWLYGWLVG